MFEVSEVQFGRAVVDTASSSVLGVNTTRTADSAHPSGGARQLLIDRFRCPENIADFVTPKGRSQSGYFQFGKDAVCYGQTPFGRPAAEVMGPLHDTLNDLVIGPSSVHLPFDPVEIIDNLRGERYRLSPPLLKTLSSIRVLQSAYYAVRPFLGVSFRRHFQKLLLRGWDKVSFPKWPVDTTVENIFETLLAASMKSTAARKVPFIWFWPEGSPSCTIMTHDVESSAGLEFCPRLMDLDDSFAIKSSFQVIPEKRYRISQSALENFWRRGFEVNVHDSNHDGRLMRNRYEFLRRVQRVNAYGRQCGARGFRSAVMYRNTEWYDALDFSYDMSIPNMAHLEPQQGGCCTVFPFFIGKILELPLTTVQDYSLFNILNHDSIRLWKQQISLVREKSGLVSFIVHPDYILSQASRSIYADLLRHLCELRSRGETWIALPGEVSNWWRLRSEMSLVNVDGSWEIRGKGSERARLAYAVMKDGQMSYEIPSSMALSRSFGGSPARDTF
jgi:hypothetical protein